jgi:hypothetical protein
MSEKKNKKLWIAGGIILVLVLIIARTGLSNTNNTTSVQSSNNTSTILTTQNDTQSKISSKNASVYINEILTVCGPVVDSRYASASKGQPTFLNFDYPYPNHTFTIVIWGQNRTNFSSPPEKKYMSKNVCIDGYIDSYKGKPQIEATSEIMISVR